MPCDSIRYSCLSCDTNSILDNHTNAIDAEKLTTTKSFAPGEKSRDSKLCKVLSANLHRSESLAEHAFSGTQFFLSLFSVEENAPITNHESHSQQTRRKFPLLHRITRSLSTTLRYSTVHYTELISLVDLAPVLRYMFVHIGIYNSKTSTQSHIYRKHIAGSIFVDKPLQNLEPFSNLLYLPRSQRSESFSFSELTFPLSNTSSQPFHQHCRQARGSSLDTYTIVKNFTAKNPEPRNLVASSNGGLVDSVATNHFAMLRLITFDGY